MHRSSLQSRLHQVASIVVPIAFSALALPAYAGQRSFVASFGNDAQSVHAATPVPRLQRGDRGHEPRRRGRHPRHRRLRPHDDQQVDQGDRPDGRLRRHQRGRRHWTPSASDHRNRDQRRRYGRHYPARSRHLGGSGAAPLPLYGIDIQNAGAVHIEKSSIGNFSQDTSACINITSTQGTDVHVDDSFLRECRTGIFATGTNHHVTVSVDHTRIQTGLGTVPTGVHLQGEVAMSLRDSAISLNDVGLQMDTLQPGANLVAISNSEIIGGNLTGILVNNTTASAVPVVSISGSQILGSDNAVLVSNSAVGGNTWVEIMDSVIGFTNNNGLVLSNSAADANTLMSLSMERSRVANTAGTAVTLNATNGSAIDMHVRDSTFIGAQTLLKTVGTASQTYVSLIRSNLSHAGTAIDHGQGNIELDSAHVNLNVRDFVNNGSGSIVSNGQNMVHNNNNPAGPTYITPAIIPLK